MRPCLVGECGQMDQSLVHHKNAIGHWVESFGHGLKGSENPNSEISLRTCCYCFQIVGCQWHCSK